MYIMCLYVYMFSTLSRRVGAFQISIIIICMSESHSAACCSLRVSVWVSLWPAAVCLCQWVSLWRSEVYMCIRESFCHVLQFICVSVSHSVAFCSLYVYQWVILWRFEVYVYKYHWVILLACCSFCMYQWVSLWHVCISESVAGVYQWVNV